MPEPMPRPMRMRFLRAPGLSAIWFSFISILVLLLCHGPTLGMAGSSPAMTKRSLRVADHAHQMLNLADHAARRQRIRQVADAADLVQAEPDPRGALVMVAPLRAADLLALDGFLWRSHDVGPLVGSRFGIAFAAARLQRRYL